VNRLPEVFIGSLEPACLYALLGVGFVIIYKSTRVINFLQGTFVYLGALIFYTAFSTLHGNFIVAVAATAICAIVVGVVLYVAIMAPLSGRGVLALIMVTLIIGTAVLAGLISIVFGPEERFFTAPLRARAYNLPGGAYITQTDIVTMGVTILFIGGLSIFLRYARFGTAMRAGAESPILAEYLGVNVRVAGAVSWALATVAAAFAGIAFAATVPISADMVSLGVYAFPAILIGGMDSVGGVLIGSVIFAVIQNSSVTYINGSVSDLTAGVVMLLILTFRPYGLFGSPEYRRL
jgi:branched-chain amino acid transport system permease protein